MTNSFTWSWDGANSAEENMARDRQLLDDINGRSDRPFAPTPRIRFYSWNSPSITVGYSQKPKEWVNLIRAHELGVEVAQRPTGGGVVFHQRDLTWSIAGHQKALGFTSIQECYQKIHQAVAAGLKKRFDLPLYLATCNDVGAHCNLPLHDDSPSFCFAVPVGYDIMTLSRKLVGGAIRWTKEGVLYQGTLPLRSDFSLLKEVVLPHRRPWLNSLTTSSSSLSEEKERKWEYQDLIGAILEGFQNELGWELSAKGKLVFGGEEDPANEMRYVWAGNRRS
ncbi:MAG: lipoate--protein ligase family protein [Candidatus Omnitrophica bacterium]|nr:lipoate--protein ligase family protein [Candidatus Omnitrophota bacterium]